MSGAPQGDSATTKAVISDSKDTSKPLAPPQKAVTQFEEDDEFEDFPVEGTRDQKICSLVGKKRLEWKVKDEEELTCLDTDWPAEEEVGASGAGTTHLWEESWDDDDTSNEFSVQLK